MDLLGPFPHFVVPLLLPLERPNFLKAKAFGSEVWLLGAEAVGLESVKKARGEGSGPRDVPSSAAGEMMLECCVFRVAAR